MKLPIAVVRKGMWKRLWSRVFATDIECYCSTCHARTNVRDDGVCFWCANMAATLEGWRPPVQSVDAREATEQLNRLREHIAGSPSPR